MNAETLLTSDVVGLTKAAPLSRRGFMTASAAVTAGYTLAAGPVRADVIKTDTDGLTVGDVKIKVADGEMPGYFARPANAARPSTEYTLRYPAGCGPAAPRLRSRPTSPKRSTTWSTMAVT